jgi:hypothetical protein
MRPVSVSVNGRKLTEQLCALPTGGYYPQDQRWQTSGSYEFAQGSASIRLDSAIPFPHISELALVPCQRK